MCYSGKCTWEDHMGDCRFPTIKVVRDKYPLPVCEIGDETEAERQRTQEIIAEIKKLL